MGWSQLRNQGVSYRAQCLAGSGTCGLAKESNETLPVVKEITSGTVRIIVPILRTLYEGQLGKECENLV